jgi:hypothetical protein
MDASPTNPLVSNPLASGLFLIAILALLFGTVSWIRALRVSATHPPFAALGLRRFTGYAAVRHMPQAAMVHVKRHLFSILVMTACLFVLFVVRWIGDAR